MQIIPAPRLDRLTTIHLGGQGIALVMPETQEDLEELGSCLEKLGGQPYMLGKGSNLLAGEGQLPFVFVSMRHLVAMEIIAREQSQVKLRVEAGVPLPRLLRFCLQHGLQGLEGLAGVPGCVGGACAMNAGSFGTEIGERVHALQIWTPEGCRVIPKEDLKFAYRKCILPQSSGFTAIISAIFTLTQAEKGGIFKRMNLGYFQKKTRQPLAAWSAGCAFKNPPNGPPAGKLLEDAGLRGYRAGGMAFSPLHANFLINEGSGSSAAAMDLLDKARYEVGRKSGHDLELEVRLIPWP